MTIHPADLELAVIEAIVERDTDPALVGLVRERVTGLLLLGPSARAATSPRERAVGDFVDQFVIDVSGIGDSLRGPLFEQLGADALGFVQALYVIDLGIRRREVLRRLDVPFPEAGPVTAPEGSELWPALLQYMRTVARMSARARRSKVVASDPSCRWPCASWCSRRRTWWRSSAMLARCEK